MEIPKEQDSSSFEVSLTFNGRNLKDADFFTKSDPFLKFYMQTSFYGKLQLIGQTEQQSNTVNPNWNKKFIVRYFFEQKQPILVQVYDSDSSKSKDYIGKASTTLGQVMASTYQSLLLDLENDKGKKTGKVIIRADKALKFQGRVLTMQWRGEKIKNVDSHFNFIDKSDPYLKVMKLRTDNSFIEVGRTEVVLDNLSPTWKELAIPINRLVTPQNVLGTFKVECWDWEEQQGKHQYIGQTFMKLQDIEKSNGPMFFELENPNFKKPGSIILEHARFQVIPDFIDYLKSGLEICMVTAIDFTGSNGVPSSPQSLHCINSQPTQYQVVLRQIWGIISDYDTDKKIPAYGFGAKVLLPNCKTNSVCHCFPMNDNPKNPEVQGFDSLMNCYVNTLRNIELSGPTYFAPILKEVLNQAKRFQGKYTYQVLVILTDGEIHDMIQTKNLIVENSLLPISIVIVGIGNAEFGKMNELDGDSGFYSSTGKKCPRDIVQFVPFNKYQGNASLLAKELLKQIPKQVVQYFKSIAVLPKIQIPSNV